MAVIATLSKGYDLDYIWKQVDRGAAKDAARETAARAHAWLARAGYLVAVPGVGMVVRPASRWPE